MTVSFSEPEFVQFAFYTWNPPNLSQPNGADAGNQESPRISFMRDSEGEKIRNRYNS